MQTDKAVCCRLKGSAVRGDRQCGAGQEVRCGLTGSVVRVDKAVQCGLTRQCGTG